MKSHENPFHITSPMWREPGPRLNIKAVFPNMAIPMLKVRGSRDRLILNMVIPILVRRHLYIETAPRTLSQYKDHLSRCGNSIMKIRWSWDCLIFIMGVPVTVTQHLYILFSPVMGRQFAHKGSQTRFFHHKSNLMGILFCYHIYLNQLIPTDFQHATTPLCCHGMCKICSHLMGTNLITRRGFGHKISNCEQKTWVMDPSNIELQCILWSQTNSLTNNKLVKWDDSIPTL